MLLWVKHIHFENCLRHLTVYREILKTNILTLRTYIIQRMGGAYRLIYILQNAINRDNSV